MRLKKFLSFLFTAGCIGLIGAYTYADYPRSCEAQPVDVHVDYDSQPVRYDLSRGARQLSTMRSDTRNPYGAGAHTENRGACAATGRSPTSKIRERVVSWPLQGQMCMSYRSVDVHIGLPSGHLYRA